MRLSTRACIVALLVACGAGCVNQQELTKRDIQKFLRTAAGEFQDSSGGKLFLAPVYARMIGLDTLYVEHTTANGTSARLISLEVGRGNKVLQIAYTFSQQNQWRNLREQPELFSALLPQDVRPAGSCDIKVADDYNTLTYSCSGSPPEKYQRVHHQLPN
jgi:hypothetical protein